MNVRRLLSIEKTCSVLIDYRGKTPPKSESGIRLVTAKVVKGGRILDEPAEFIPEEIYDGWMNRGLPRHGDVVVTTEAPLGEVGLLRSAEKVALGQRLILLRANPELADQRYLYYALQGPEVQAELKRRATGTTVVGIKQAELRQVQIPFWPLDIQRQIAGILSAYDDLIEVNTRRIAILDEMARRIFDELFVRPVEKLPIPGDRLNDWSLPAGWRFRCLADVAMIVMGQSPPSDTYNSEGRGLPFHQGVTDFESFFHRNRLFVDGADRPRLAEPGDILFSVRAPVARIARALDNMVLGRGLAAIRPTSDYATYIFSYLRSMFPHTDMIGNGAIYKAVTKDDVRSLPIIWPHDKSIEQFERHAAAVWGQIKILYLSNRSLRTARDILLPKLISGEIDVSGAERQAKRIVKRAAAE